MNTDQKYAGKGDFANLTERTADNASQTEQSQAEAMQVYKPVGPKTELLNTVRTFCADREVASVIEVINDLTLDWLKQLLESREDADRDAFSTHYVTNTLFTMNKVTEFMVKLDSINNAILWRKARQEDAELLRAYEENNSLLTQLTKTQEQKIKELEERANLTSASGESDK